MRVLIRPDCGFFTMVIISLNLNGSNLNGFVGFLLPLLSAGRQWVLSVWQRVFGFAVLGIFHGTFQKCLPDKFETKRNGP